MNVGSRKGGFKAGKKDPVDVLLAADIGFTSAAEVEDNLFWEVFGP